MPFRFAVSALVLMIAASSAAAAGGAGLSRWPKGYNDVHQMNGCRLVGPAFGQIFTKGGVIYKGVSYAIADEAVAAGQITYSGPQVTAVFKPRAGGRLIEIAGGLPSGVDGPHGLVEIRVAGHVVTVPAQEQCVVFE